MIRSFLTTILLFSLININLEPAFAQENQLDSYIDYAAFPKRDFNFTKAKISYKYDQEKEVLLGKVVYSVEPLWSDVNTIKLLAFRMQIDEVRIDNELASYNLQNDTLFITLPKINHKDPFVLEVMYGTDLYYGLHKDRFGTIWTSNLPYSTAHYLPGFIHPRNRLITEVTFDVPKEYLVAAPGRLFKAEIQPNSDRRIVEWKTNEPISVTDFKFAIGKFELDDIQFGAKKIRLFTTQHLITKEEKAQIVSQAYNQIKRVENKLNQEYPFLSLSLVYLADSRWESKSYAASIGFLNHAQGSVNKQLERIVAAQWFGVLKQTEQWKTAEIDVDWQAWLQASFQKEDGLLGNEIESSDFLESPFDLSVYQDKVNRFLSDKNERWFTAFEESYSSLLGLNRSILAPREHIELLYRNSGRTFTGLEEVSKSPEIVHKTTVKVDYVEMQKKARITINQEKDFTDLESIEVILVTPKSRLVKKITLQSSLDSLLLDVPKDLKNVYVNFKNGTHSLEYQKPYFFWLNQFKDEKIAELRYEAVLEIRKDTSNPDLQLMVFDALKSESEPQIKAELIRWYADLTKGATGTDVYFLEQFRTDSEEIKLASLDAFRWFKGNEAIVLNVKSVIKNGVSLKIKQKALSVLNELLEPEEYKTYLLSYLKSVKTNHAILLALTQLRSSFAEQLDSKLWLNYTQMMYSYEVRSFAIQAFLEQTTAEEHSNEFEEWLNDYDPRIRYNMLDFVQHFPKETQKTILNSRIVNEYDSRLREKAVLLLNQKDLEK